MTRLLGFPRAPEKPQQARDEHERLALLPALPHDLSLLERLAGGHQRLVELVREMELVRALLVQARLLLHRQRLRIAQRPAELLRSLAMRPERRGALGRLRRKLEDGVAVACGLGVMGEPGDVAHL